jgi:hypothetical protein
MPVAARDDDTPDLGYHYPPLDYITGALRLENATLTFTNGVGVGFSDWAGVILGEGARIVSQGDPITPNWLVGYRSVQEEPAFDWANPVYHFFEDPSVSGEPKEIMLESTRTSDAWLFSGGKEMAGIDLKDCQVTSGGIYTGYTNSIPWTVALTNNLFLNANLTLATGTSNLTLFARNNLVRYGSMTFYPPPGNDWEIKDNFFESVENQQNSNGISNGFNGYLRTPNRFQPSSGTDLVLTTFEYAQGPLGPYLRVIAISDGILSEVNEGMGYCLV